MKRLLTPRQRALAAGTSGLSSEREEAYRRRWSGEKSRGAVATQRRNLDCIHRGERTGRKVDCKTCGDNRVSLFVFSCAVHVECAMGSTNEVKSCGRCDERDPGEAA